MPSHSPCDHHVQQSRWWKWCPKSIRYIILHITTYYWTSQSLSQFVIARIMNRQVLFEAHIQDVSGKGGNVYFAHHIHPWFCGRLPVVQAGDWLHPVCCSNGTHYYNHYLASTDSSREAGDCCLTYLVNSWALGWSSKPWVVWSAMKCSLWHLLLHVITHWPLLLHWPLLCIIISI